MAGKNNIFGQACVRVVLLLTIVMIVFGIVRQQSVPESFGQYGGYRGDSIQENLNIQVSFAEGSGTCAKCHDIVLNELRSAQHAGIDCQTCHGPGEKHKENPKVITLKITGINELCATCHTTIAGRRGKGIATVEPVMHSGGVICIRCHNPHQPLGGRNG